MDIAGQNANEYPLERLWGGILALLADVGVVVHHEPALRLFQELGANVHLSEKRVRIGAALIEKTRSALARDFTLFAKKPELDLSILPGRYFTIGGGVGLSYYENGSYRAPIIADLLALTRLQDALAYPDIVNTSVQPKELPQDSLGARLFALVYPRTRKHHFAQAFSREEVGKLVAIARLVQQAGGLRSVKDFSVTVCLQSPLAHSELAGEVLMSCAEHGIPLFINVSPIEGATSPISVEGTILEKFANFLAALVLVQAIRPGVPCVFSSASSLIDLKTARYISFAPIQHYGHALSSRLARWIGFPYQNSLMSDSKEPDAQYAIQKTLGILFSIMYQATFSNLQIMSQMTVSSKEHLILDNEIVKNIEALFKGAERSQGDFLQAFRESSEVNFLLEEGNVDYFKRNAWFSDTFDYRPLELWLADRKGCLQNARAEADSIIAESGVPEDAALNQEISRALEG